jgi:hypothetical protein
MEHGEVIFNFELGISKLKIRIPKSEILSAYGS